jgi:hypothetical protein
MADEAAPAIGRDFAVPRMRMTLRRGQLSGPVALHAVGAFAARTSLPVDRLTDVAGVAEALATSLPGDQLTLEARIERGGDELLLSASGLAPGTTRSVLSGVRHDGLAQLLSLTADGVSVRSTTRQGETMTVNFSAPR